MHLGKIESKMIDLFQSTIRIPTFEALLSLDLWKDRRFASSPSGFIGYLPLKLKIFSNRPAAPIKWNSTRNQQIRNDHYTEILGKNETFLPEGVCF